MWVAYDTTNDIAVQYSDSPYSSWNGPILLKQGVTSDDISVVTALPDGTVGVLWSDQSTDRFGFRVHIDGTDPTNWLADEPAGPVRCQVQIRYNSAAASATVGPLPDGRMTVAFDEPQYGIAPGQAVVCYDEDQVLGGGWIE